MTPRTIRRSALTGCQATLMVALCVGGCIRRIDHSPTSAGASARAFAEAAFVRGDEGEALALLSPEMQREVGREGLSKTLAQMHPRGRPNTIALEAYEPRPGQAAMTLFLTGEGGGERCYYRLEMRGDAERGYRVTQFERSGQPYPVGAGRRAFPRPADG